MKKLLALVLCLVLVFGLAPSVFADAPVVLVNPIEDHLILDSEGFSGYVFEVSGLVNVSEDFDNKINNITVSIVKDGVPYLGASHGAEVLVSNKFNIGAWGVNDLNFKSRPVTVQHVGNYTITVEVKFVRLDASGTESFEISEVIVVVDYPAAPAIANELLKEAGVSHRYGRNGNYISDIAKIMGKSATFNGVEKSDLDAYREAVRNYLIEVGAI